MNRKIIVLLFAGVLMGALDIAVIGPALPAIQSSLLISARDLPWLFNIYILFNLISTPLMGKLSDLYGRRLIYVVDISLFTLGSLIVILSGSFEMLLIGRGVQGFGAGGIFPVAAAVIGDTVPKEKQGSALGWIGAVFGFAFIIGPVIGGALLLLSWHWIFAINLPIAAILIYYSLRLLPNIRKTGPISFDWGGIGLLILMLASFAYGLNRIDTTDFFNSILSPSVFLFLLFPLPAAFAFLHIEKKVIDPAVHINLLKSKQLSITYLIAFGAGIGELSSIYIPSLAIASFNISKSAASFMMLPLVFVLFVMAPVAGKLIDKAGAKPVISFGILALFMGLAAFAFIPLTRISFYLSEMAIGLGLAFLLGAPLRYIMNHETSQDNRAAGQALLTLFTSMGQLMSAALVAALISSLGGGIDGFHSGFMALAVASIIILFLSFLLKNTKYNSI
jgi:MFS family permease